MYYPRAPENKIVTLHPYLPIMATSLQRWERFDCIVSSRLSDSGEDTKVKGTRKVGGAGKRKKETAALPLPSLLPFFFSLRFLNLADLTISEPGTG